MKKLISLMLALCLGCLLIPAMAEEAAPAVTPVTFAAVIPAASAEEFYGEWTLLSWEVESEVLDGPLANIPNVKISEGAIEFIPASENDPFAMMFNALNLKGTFEDGKLSFGTLGAVEMLEDGMIKMSVKTVDSGIMTLYYVPAPAEEAPAA